MKQISISLSAYFPLLFFRLKCFCSHFTTVFLLFILLSPQNLSAQRIQSENVSNRAMRFYDESTEHLNWDRFKEAEELLVRAVEISPEFKEAHFRLGFIYLQLYEWDKAEKHLEKVNSINPQFHSNVYYGLGEATFFNDHHEKSKAAFEKYLTFRVSEERKIHAERRLVSIEFAKKAKQNPLPFEPTKIESLVSTSLSEYFPVLTADSRILFFTRMDEDDGFMHENVYVAFREDGKWKSVYPLGAPVNTNENEAVNSISPDGRTIYLTMCNRQGNYGTCDIYFSERTGNRWSRPQNMGATINSSAWDGHPAISPDGNTLIFASTRGGGYGGQDLWLSERDRQGNWSEPVNLGPEINSDGDEKTPYLHFDNRTLYYSSDGLPGMGGEDIFISRYADGKWQKPQNLGYPINSKFNDLGLFVNAAGDTAYFASDRFGTPEIQNLYYFELTEELRPNPVSWISGIVTNSKNNQPIEALIEISNVQTSELAAAVHSDPTSGRFLIPFPIGERFAYHASASGFLFHSENFFVEKTTTDGFQLEISLSPIEAGAELTLRNVFFEHDEYVLDPTSKVELNKLVDFLNLHPNRKIEIQGHTDNVGQAAYNKTLSEKRAASVKSFLIENGIEQARLIAKGYGETKPVADNQTEEGRAKNRRTAIVFLDD